MFHWPVPYVYITGVFLSQKLLSNQWLVAVTQSVNFVTSIKTRHHSPYPPVLTCWTKSMLSYAVGLYVATWGHEVAVKWKGNSFVHRSMQAERPLKINSDTRHIELVTRRTPGERLMPSRVCMKTGVQFTWVSAHWSHMITQCVSS